MRFETNLRRKVCGAAVAFAIFSVQAGARAHGGIPRAYGIIFEPGNPEHIVLRSDVWGIFRSIDGGKTWNYGCAELYGARWSQATHLTVAVTAGGRILVPNQSIGADSKLVGLGMSDDLCNWRTAPALAGKLVEEVTQVGNDLFLITADGVDGGILGHLYKSSDKGDSWAIAGTPLPTDFSGQSILFAPSDPKRVVVLGEIINTGATTALLETSSDGGATWTRTGGRIEEDNADWYPRLYGVHPTRPDVVFAHADAVEGRNQNSPDDVWATGDGGTTWNKVFAGTGDLPGFAFSPDGTKVLVSGPLDGIQEATVDDALANGPAAFKKIFDGQVWGLNWTADGLYAGNNDFTLDKKPTPFTLGVSHDEGLSFSPLMTVCDVTFATCDPSATMSVCMASWTIADSTPGNGGYKEDYLEGNRCVGSVPTGDAGVTPAQPGSDNSSGCTQSNIRPRRGSSLGALLCAVGLVALKRRQRGRDAASTRSARGTVPKSPRA